MSLADRVDEIPDGLPPSALYVLRVLVDADAMTSVQIERETLLPDRTVRYALDQLRDADLVESRPSTVDPRKQLHSATLGR